MKADAGYQNPLWYVVRTKNNMDWTACHKLSQLGLKTFQPCYLDRNIRGVCIKVPLFKGYIFIDIPSPSIIHKINTTIGVHSILSSVDKIPIGVRNSVIQDIRLMLDHIKTLPEQPLITLTKGDKVTIANGPLTNLQGTVLEYVCDKATAKILVHLLGKSTKLTIKTSQVRLS